MLPLLPVAIVGLAGLAYFKVRGSKAGEMTPERKMVYETALATEKDPEKLKTLAEAYKAEGLKAPAEMLQKRAALRLLPPEVKEQRRDAFKKGMTSTEPEKVMTLAKAFNAEGATGAAASLKKYAVGLKTAETAKKKAPAKKPAPKKPAPAKKAGALAAKASS